MVSNKIVRGYCKKCGKNTNLLYSNGNKFIKCLECGKKYD